ncbi:MAG TPA: Maf family protein [Bacilli bacterium]|nr:Maf family protein [Bacilli bacterium]
MFILASQSPRRQKLMRSIASHFSVDVSQIDESKSLHLPPPLAVQDIAYRKGEAVAKNHPGDIVISADTIVVLENQIIGKPKDEDDALRILKLLSNKMHTVITAFCIFHDGTVMERSVHSQVIMNQLSDDLIKNYIRTKSPLDKAGAYGVQDNKKFPLVKSIIGSVHNVIGFPIEEIKSDLKRNHLQ